MKKKQRKIRGAIRDLLYNKEETDQPGLFDVSDMPLRKSVFEQDTIEQADKNSEDSDQNTKDE